MRGYKFYSNCISWNTADLESLEDMIDNGEEIEYNELTEYVNEDVLDDVFTMYRDCPLSLEKDCNVRYFKSNVNGEHCVYVVHSAIEYVFKK